jgi:hypothetical protein
MITINNNTNQITFTDSRFYTTESGDFVPSVTTIGDAYPKGAEYFSWLKKVGEDADTIRDEAGRRGSVVHELTERFDRGDKINLIDGGGRIGFKLSEWAMFEKYVDFRDNHNVEHKLIEVNMISEKLGYAGTMDRYSIINGVPMLIDIKTSGAIYPFYWLQLAAYKELMKEKYPDLKVEQVGILWLNAKTRTAGKGKDIQGTGWQLVTKSDTTKELELFNATHKLWLAENGTMKPKSLNYNLSYQLAK